MMVIYNMLTISVMNPRLGGLLLLQLGLQLIFFVDVRPLYLLTQFADLLLVHFLELKDGLLYPYLEVSH